MTSFTPLKPADDSVAEFEPQPTAPAKRPSRWSLTNWPVRWKVFAIVLVPLILAATFGGMRIYSSATQATDLRLAADRAELVPALESYMAALEGAIVTGTEGGDPQAAVASFDARKSDLRQRLDSTDLVADVRLSINTLLDYGQELVNKVTSNSINLRQRVARDRHSATAALIAVTEYALDSLTSPRG